MRRGKTPLMVKVNISTELFLFILHCIRTVISIPGLYVFFPLRCMRSPLGDIQCAQYVFFRLSDRFLHAGKLYPCACREPGKKFIHYVFSWNTRRYLPKDVPVLFLVSLVSSRLSPVSGYTYWKKRT